MSDTGTTQGSESPRVAEFRNEIDGLKLKGGSAEGEKRLLALGVIMMVVGLVLAAYGAIQVGLYGDSPADQRAYTAQGSLMGIALIIVGAALFLRYSLARYLRFWLIRTTYEQQANTDRVVAAIDRASAPIEAAPPHYVTPLDRSTVPPPLPTTQL